MIQALRLVSGKFRFSKIWRNITVTVT